jgi:hypothetical protein
VCVCVCVCVCVFVCVCVCVCDPLIVLCVCVCVCRLREDLLLEEPYEEMCDPLIQDVVHSEEVIRKAAADTLAKTLTHNPGFLPATLAQLLDKYQEKLYVSNFI